MSILEEYQSGEVPSLSLSPWFITVHVNLDHLGKVVSVWQVPALQHHYLPILTFCSLEVTQSLSPALIQGLENELHLLEEVIS